MSKVPSRYTLPGPCSNCPFRRDLPIELRPERVVEIAETLLNGNEFECHKTVDYSGDEPATVARTRVCGGAVATLAREGKDTQMSRITERLGGKLATIDPEAPVFDSVAEWATAMNPPETVTRTFLGVETTLPMEHCGVVSADCEDPAGFMLGGGATSNPSPGTCDPFETCESCGNTMCDSCRAEDDPSFCVDCYEPEEDDE